MDEWAYSLKLHCYSPTEAFRICEQPLWKNNNIKINGVHVQYKQWGNTGVKYVQDILQRNGKILDKINQEKTHNIRCKYLEYETLVGAIPRLPN
jgi:hypothetical protein